MEIILLIDYLVLDQTITSIIQIIFKKSKNNLPAPYHLMKIFISQY